jgi:hypothetical protein
MGYRNISQGYGRHSLLEAEWGFWHLGCMVLKYLVLGLEQSWYKTDRDLFRARSLCNSQNESILYKGANFLRNSITVRSEPFGNCRFTISCTRIGVFLVQDVPASREVVCHASA